MPPLPSAPAGVAALFGGANAGGVAVIAFVLAIFAFFTAPGFAVPLRLVPSLFRRRLLVSPLERPG